MNTFTDPAVAVAFELAMRDPDARHDWMRRALWEIERRLREPGHDVPSLRAARADLVATLRPELDDLR